MHNVIGPSGESYMLYTIAGADREKFSKFPMPRNTTVFAPTFQGVGIVRSADITKDTRYGQNSPHFGMPEGHLPVRSYLAVPVKAQSGEVLGGLFYGHESINIFDKESEDLVGAIAGQAAVAIENARLKEELKQKIEVLEKAGQVDREVSKRLGELAAIVKSSQEVIVSKDLNGIIMSWNEAAERLFGYDAAEAIGSDILMLVPSEERGEVMLRFALLMDGVRPPNFEAVRIAKDGRHVEVAGTLSPIRDSSQKLTGVSLIFRDIGERKRAEGDHAQLAAIVESSNDAILIRGLDHTILSWNAAAERLFGWTAAEAVGQPIDLIVPPERTGNLRRFVEGTVRGETMSPVETIHLRKDGARIPTQITFSPVKDQQGKVIAHSYTVRDMTEFKRKEETLRGYASRLRKLSYRLRTVEEKERHAISRELHDRIGQELSTLGLILGSLGARLPQESLRTVEKQMHDMQALLKSIVENVRDVMAALRPPVLDDYGLLAALRQLAVEFAQRSGIAAELSGADLQSRLPPIVETAMYRISKEALNNVAKHAQAKHVEISLHEVSGRVILDIADDGVGFYPNQVPPDTQHWGLTTMRERAEAVGIEFRLGSAPGAGTRIILEAERAAI